MRERKNDLTAKNIKVAVVSFESGFLARGYIEETGLEWPLLVDETREIYRAYGMLDAGFWDIWGPRTWLAYCKELLRGRLPKKTSGDTRQRGGDVLIDPEGIVRLHHVGTGPADRPEVDAILKAVF
ncbi:MAG: redoxin domain-containing protein [Deltaproteobacteria bacterium]|nr:redoxin domain-containing protein [Deltaproteobacteria bacterium]